MSSPACSLVPVLIPNGTMTLQLALSSAINDGLWIAKYSMTRTTKEASRREAGGDRGSSLKSSLNASRFKPR
ncbi:hypothetical protein EV421DRAFT_1908487 [Armillaria borealis]|uniref:Uncharacterized protein n=1 Tax=Armillaria borealis TaxID=47425 RepID=A0AA39MJE3_9AGAR|nr:hypothetical protein EV421DRAFT_1908487 [Armillaria borealis]